MQAAAREAALHDRRSTPAPASTRPDYLATIDLDPASQTYSQVIHRLAMPNVGDELHHFGWNACASCHGEPGTAATSIIPGLVSGRIHIVDTAEPARAEDAQGDRAGRDRSRKTEADRAAHRPLPGRRPDHDLDARRREGRGAGRLPAARRQVRRRRPLGGEPRGDEVQLRLLVPAAAQRDGQSASGPRPTRPARASSSTTSRPASTASSCTSGTGRSAKIAKTHRPRRRRA